MNRGIVVGEGWRVSGGTVVGRGVVGGERGIVVGRGMVEGERSGRRWRGDGGG